MGPGSRDPCRGGQKRGPKLVSFAPRADGTTLLARSTEPRTCQNMTDTQHSGTSSGLIYVHPNWGEDADPPLRTDRTAIRTQLNECRSSPHGRDHHFPALGGFRLGMSWHSPSLAPARLPSLRVRRAEAKQGGPSHADAITDRNAGSRRLCPVHTLSRVGSQTRLSPT